MSDVDEMVVWLRAVLDELWLLATEASRPHREGASAVVDGGEHWQWECSNCDTTVVPDLDVEFMSCPACGGWGLELRSREQYPTPYGGDLPSFVISGAEEVRPVVGAFLLRNDPAVVLRRVEADRRILDLHERHYTGYAREPGECGVCLKWEYNTGAEMEPWPCPTVRVLASGWSHMPGYRSEWSP